MIGIRIVHLKCLFEGNDVWQGLVVGFAVPNAQLEWCFFTSNSKNMLVKLDFPKGSGMIQKNLETTTKYKKPCNWGVIFSIVFCGVIFWNETANSRAILSKVLPNLEKNMSKNVYFGALRVVNHLDFLLLMAESQAADLSFQGFKQSG